MARYRQIANRARRPLAGLFFLLGLFFILEAIVVGRGVDAYMTAVPVIGGSLVAWYMPSGRAVHPPSESTLQWARKRRRSNDRA